MANILEWIKGEGPENPSRIKDFRARLDGLVWDEIPSKQSIDILFNAVNDLAEAEVSYYFRRRRTRALVSSITRILAWVFGTVGLLLPLLTGANPEIYKSWGPYGYLFLATAGSFLAANSLFGGTHGHIRFVVTQLEIEKLITNARIGWCKFLAMPVQEGEGLDQGFELVLSYATALHAITILETGKWGESTLTALAKFEKSVDTASQPEEKKKQKP